MKQTPYDYLTNEKLLILWKHSYLPWDGTWQRPHYLDGISGTVPCLHPASCPVSVSRARGFTLVDWTYDHRPLTMYDLQVSFMSQYSWLEWMNGLQAASFICDLFGKIERVRVNRKKSITNAKLRINFCNRI
jgi:hypothetical protein